MSNELCPSKVHHGLFSWAGASYLACVGNVRHTMANHIVRLPTEPIHPLGSGPLEKEASNPGTSALWVSLACHHGYDSDDQCGLSRYHLICICYLCCCYCCYCYCPQVLSLFKRNNLVKRHVCFRGQSEVGLLQNIGNIGNCSRKVNLDCHRSCDTGSWTLFEKILPKALRTQMWTA